MLRRPQPLASLACCLLVGLAGCSGGSQESPEACFNGFRSAMAAGDYPTALCSFSDETQDLFAAALVLVKPTLQMMQSMGGEEDPKLTEVVATISSIYEKHGVADAKTASMLEKMGGPMGIMLKMNMGQAPTDAEVANVADVVDNKPGFILDMVQALASLDPGNSEAPNLQEMIEKLAAAKLVDVKIDGDKATAKIEGDGELSDEVTFRKTAEGWKFHIDLQALAASRRDEMEMGELEMGEMNMEEFGDAAGDEMEMDIEEFDANGATEEMEFDANPAEFEADEEAVAK
ncbi:MAG: hypothetical protein KDA44_20020 [Planctomycetales bacterium]|nr:hypothetical protein [Planctomycetales bacterium]